jgi:hypothetical protein
VFDGPAGGSCAEPCIAGVDVCALLNKEFDDGAVSAECSVVNSCCAGIVLVVDEFWMSGEDGSDLFQCALLRRFDQSLEFVHGCLAAHAINRL